MKIPRDAARPKLEDLIYLADEIPHLPFQPDEEDVLNRIIDNAQSFREHIARLCNPIVSTEAELETQRFFLRKLEGAEVLLSYETNFFRQELHKWCPVAPEPPPILEVSLSTRKPRPTKLQKMLAEYGVENPDDLPEHAKGKANSLRRKAANAEAAAAAAHNANGPLLPPSGNSAYGGPSFYVGSTGSADSATSPSGHADNPASSSDGHQTKTDPMEGVSGFHTGLLGSGGPMFVDNSAVSLEERLLRGQEDDVDLNTAAGKSKALEILSRTEVGRKQAEKIWGSNVWGPKRGSMSEANRSISPVEVDDPVKHDEGNVDQMFKEMTNQEDDEDSKKKDDNTNTAETVTAESFESERNGLDAMIDGE
jgi:histone demethylase JARID1